MTWTPPPPSGVAGLDPTALRARLIQNGWGALPIRKHSGAGAAAGKAPGITGWQEYASFDAALPSLATLDDWKRRERDWPGTGIPCGVQVAIDLDFGTDAQMAEQVRAIAFATLGETPFERQGSYPKTLLVYRAAESIPSLHLKAADGSGDGLDVLSDGTQFVAFGIHPKTLNPYAWTGAETPLTAEPDAAPEVAQAQIDDFVARVRTIIELNGTGGRAGRRGGGESQIIRDEWGRVIDGREKHLTRTVYATARTMRSEGLDLDCGTLTARAWERFTETAHISDGHWGRIDAEIRARALIVKWKSGRLDLEPEQVAEAAARPTYEDRRQLLIEAERATRTLIADFFGQHVPAWQAERAAWEVADTAYKAAQEAGGKDDEEPAKPVPTSHAGRIETATGKTRVVSRAIAKAAKSGVAVIYAAPMHVLLEEVAPLIRAEGVEAMVYRGYTVADPELPGMAMCHDLTAVEDARSVAARSVRESVCDRKVGTSRLLCRFHDQCGMQRQREAKATVWLVPHSLLFQAKPKFIPTPDAIVIDENITMGALPNQPVRMTLDAFDSADCTVPSERDAFNLSTNDLEVARASLSRALRAHPKEGGPLQRSFLLRHGVTAALAGSAMRLEWMRQRDPGVEPGMDPKARRALVNAVGAHNKELKAFAGLWHELKTFLATGAEASGRLLLRYDEENECRVLERRSLDTLADSWSAPCLLLDATLPDPALIAPVLGHPVEVRADIAARWSEHGSVRQIINAPVSSAKLGIIEGRESEVPRRSVTDLLRLIHLRAALIEPGRVVVIIGPKRLVERLHEIGLPENVECGHFGAVAGIDRWNAAAGLIVVGQMQPGPRIVEALAGIVTGLVPNALPEATGKGHGVWFPRVEGGIRLADGSAARVEHARHPDPIVEALRWQITEAGLIQAVGRLRALRRGADSSYFLDIINDVPLPLTVDRVETWDSAKPDAWAGMAPEGVLMESAGDIQACFPDLAPTRQTAREMAVPTVVVTPIVISLIGVTTTLKRASYKRLGRYRPASALLLPNAPADLKSWLAERLGAIEWVRIEDAAPAKEAEAPPSPARPRLAADYDPALVARYACVAQAEPQPSAPPTIPPAPSRFDPAAPIGFPPAIRARLASAPRSEQPNARETGSGPRPHFPARPHHTLRGGEARP